MATDQDILMLQMSADIRGMQKQLQRAGQLADSEANSIQRRFDRIKLGGGGNFTKALQTDLGGLKSSLLGATGMMSGFTTVLDALGPVGLAAGVGVAAFGAALGALKVAAAVADEIGDTATVVGVSTDALQEWRYVIHATGGDVHDADAALKQFNITLGLARSGLSPKAAKGFKALGLDAKDFEDTDSALKAVIDRISKLGNASEQAAVADKLGLTPLLPAIREGSKRIDELRAAAERLGYVMDANVVAQLGDVHDKMEDLAKVAGNQAAAALVNLAPLILSVGSAFVSATKDLNGFLRMLGSLKTGAPAVVQADLEQQIKVVSGIAKRAAEIRATPWGAIKAGVPVINAFSPDAREHEARNVERQLDPATKRLSALQAQMLQAYAAPPTKEGPKTDNGPHLIAPTKGGGKKAPEDRSDQIVDQAKKALADALERAASAQLDAVNNQISEDEKTSDGRRRLSADIDQRARIEQDQLKNETDSKLIGLSRQKSEIEAAAAAKRITPEKAKEAIADIALAERAVKASAAAQSDLIVRKAISDKLSAYLASLDHQLAIEGDLASETQRMADIMGAMAKTAADRQKAALISLKSQQAEEERGLNSRLVRGDIDGAEWAKENAAMQQRHGMEVQQTTQNTQGPRDAGRADAEGEATNIAAGIVRADDMAGRYEAMYAQIGRMREADELSFDQAERAKAQIAAQYTAERLANASTFFANLATLQSSSNKKIAAIGKAAAIMEATIQGYVAVQNALATKAPWPLPLAFAAAAGVAAAVNVAHIAGVAGFAQGTNSAPGGTARVGEFGPEVVNLSAGAQVIPNDVLRNLAAMRVSSRQSVQQTIVVHVAASEYFDARVEAVASPIATRVARVAASAGAALSAQGASRRSRQALS